MTTPLQIAVRALSEELRKSIEEADARKAELNDELKRYSNDVYRLRGEIGERKDQGDVRSLLSLERQLQTAIIRRDVAQASLEQLTANSAERIQDMRRQLASVEEDAKVTAETASRVSKARAKRIKSAVDNGDAEDDSQSSSSSSSSSLQLIGDNMAPVRNMRVPIDIYDPNSPGSVTVYATMRFLTIRNKIRRDVHCHANPFLAIFAYDHSSFSLLNAPQLVFETIDALFYYLANYITDEPKETPVTVLQVPSFDSKTRKTKAEEPRLIYSTFLFES